MTRTKVGQAPDIIFVWNSELKCCSSKKESPPLLAGGGGTFALMRGGENLKSDGLLSGGKARGIYLGRVRTKENVNIYKHWTFINAETLRCLGEKFALD